MADSNSTPPRKITRASRKRHPAIAEVARLMLEMSDEGKFVLLGKAQDVAAQWPKANPCEVISMTDWRRKLGIEG